MRRLARWRFGRYILVGLLCAGVDTGTVWLLDRHGASTSLAVTLGFVAGFLLNFLLHARFTFSMARLALGQFARFIAVAAINYLFTLAIVGVLHDLAGLDVVVAKVISLVPIAVNGYFLSKVWVFRKPRASTGDAA
jgi:putative flippase GtrA